MALKCDLQYGRGEAGYRLTRVGVKGVRKPVVIKREGAGGTLNNTLYCSFDICVDLPAEQKGSHMSRNVEVLNEVVEESIRTPVTALEDMAADICRRLLVRHEYAMTADVVATAEYFRGSVTPLGKPTFEIYELMAGGHIERDGVLLKKIGVEAVGMTACPCGQQTVTEMLGYETDLPVMTHNQRNVCSVVLDLPEDVSVEADILIDIIEDSFSSPTYELLKRPDEGQVIINAHRNTKFVEDVVRGVLDRLVKKFPDLPDDVFVDVISESEESIHKHNAFAEREATLGELRSENQ
ncbi:MAG: GTP cyclohydrolase I FolE2 [Candidatus Methanomethylophilaceae archaeon]|nr:GTP cyclohydrolase I FolE2 [Candidatus Methanomethylophilaceae archaeon]